MKKLILAKVIELVTVFFARTREDLACRDPSAPITNFVPEELSWVCKGSGDGKCQHTLFYLRVSKWNLFHVDQEHTHVLEEVKICCHN